MYSYLGDICYNQPKHFRIHITGWHITLERSYIRVLTSDKSISVTNVISFLHAEYRVGPLILSAAAAKMSELIEMPFGV